MRSLIEQGAVLIASSDFTHYGANFGYLPFKKDIPENLKKLDMGAVQKILDMDSKGFSAYVAKTGATICGGTPTAPPSSRPEATSNSTEH